ncbi:MAG: hypothetical protein IJZ51_08705 [Ruminiclostridium sp.]|nr:hypothetical protein [Ruminiclostridium sp.]
MIKKLISLLIAMAMILPVMVTPVAYAVEISPAQTVSGVQATDMLTVAKQLAKAKVDEKRYFECYVYQYGMTVRVDSTTKTAIVIELEDYYWVTIPETIEDLNYYWGYDEDSFEFLDLYGDFEVIGITAESTYSDQVVEIPESVVYIQSKSLGFCNGEYIETQICAPKGSAAITYAKKYGLDYVELYSFKDATISFDEIQFTYTGNEICPTTHVYYGDKELEDGTDYYLIYENNVNAGTATVTAYGIGSYRGELSASFVISPQTIDTSLLTVKVPKSMAYNKKGIYEKLAITYDGKTLTAGTDFVVSGLSDKIGSVTGKIVFKGNYSGKNQSNSILLWALLRSFMREELTRPPQSSHGRMPVATSILFTD